jgi:hypothetical protein
MVFISIKPSALPVNIRAQQLHSGEIDHIVLRGEFLTDVGQWQRGVLYSTGNEGWLQVGLYVTMPAGRYRVEWFGKLESSPSEEIGFVDVFL